MSLHEEMEQLKDDYRVNANTFRLAASYLAIIMVLSFSFSIVFYRTSISALDRQLPPTSFYQDRMAGTQGTVRFDDFFRDRISEGRSDLLGRLFLINLLALFLGSIVSYFLARASLQPIEEAMEAQSRFSSDASHELRTPLTAIRTRNEVALRKPKLSNTEAREVIQSNLNETIKLERLSEGLLKLAKQDGQPLLKTAVSLDESAGEAMNKVISSAQAKHISIDETVPKMSVLADTVGLTQVITILLENAVKYSPEGTTITLQGNKKGKHGYLSVKDQGQGIKAEDLPHIFDRFYRTDHARAKQGEDGYGLGLSIAKQIIDQHGGEITATSAPGKGSIFTIKLALA